MARDLQKAIPFDPEELFGAIDSGNVQAVGEMLKPAAKPFTWEEFFSGTLQKMYIEGEYTSWAGMDADLRDSRGYGGGR